MAAKLPCLVIDYCRLNEMEKKNECHGVISQVGTRALVLLGLDRIDLAVDGNFVARSERYKARGIFEYR